MFILVRKEKRQQYMHQTFESNQSSLMMGNKRGGSNNYGGYSQDPFEEKIEEDDSKVTSVNMLL